MKLAKIEHVRCDEPDCTTYVWTPDDWDEKQFRAALKNAEKAYLSAYQEWQRIKDEAPEKYFANYKDELEFYQARPELSVAQAKAEWEEAFARRKAWEVEYNKGQQTFAEFLELEGLTAFIVHEPDFSACINWGHQHGASLKYWDNSANIDRKDLPGPLVYDPDDWSTEEHDWLPRLVEKERHGIAHSLCHYFQKHNLNPQNQKENNHAAS